MNHGLIQTNINQKKAMDTNVVPPSWPCVMREQEAGDRKPFPWLADDDLVPAGMVATWHIGVRLREQSLAIISTCFA